MKIQILGSTGNKVKDLDTKIFDGKIREDIIQKIVEVEKYDAMQEWAPSYLAGNQTSASGNVRHLRHMWKSDRGRGMSRVPKKRMSRRGNRFHWEGAVIPSTKGGRRAHPPKVGRKDRKINKKEMILALKSALAMVASADVVKEKYARLKDKEVKDLPIVIEEKVLALKTKEFVSAIKKILGDIASIGFKEKKVRAGKGTMRGRKYKKSAGLLLVKGDKEDKKIRGIDIVDAKDVKVSDLATNGARLVVFTEAAIKELENRLGEKKK
jgi:large subunit ribosomal protein L4e